MLKEYSGTKWKVFSVKQILKRLFAAVAAIVLLFAPVSRAEYIGSNPDEGVYIVQSQRHTCTLIAATMMLRNYASLADGLYEQVTESAVRSYGWNSKGLKWEFCIGMVNVECSHEIRAAANKKEYLILCLRQHPEGIVIYDADAPHAIWLFGYDEAEDTFYCADTTTDVAGRAISLEESILRGETQEEKIERLDRIWYVKSGEITL